MSPAGLLVAFILALIVFFIIAAPLIERRRAPDASEGDPQIARQRERLQLYYERVVRNLRDLDEDNALGKIEPELYARDRALWVERGVQALKALDDLAAQEAVHSSTPADAVSNADSDIDAAIEAAVQRAKQSAG